MTQLQQLFSITTGYTFRDAIADSTPGTVGIIQAGDVNTARLRDIPRIQFENKKHLLQPDDIILSARGKVAARTITEDILPAVAASSVFVLRPSSTKVNSRYIAWYLNSNSGQAALRQISSGSHISTFRKPDLATLPIPLPPPEAQETLVKLHDNIEQQRAILKLNQQLLEDLDNRIIKQITGEDK